MNMTTYNEILTKLKDPKQVVIFKDRTPVEQKILIHAGTEGTLLVTNECPDGREHSCFGMMRSSTFILKPNWY